MTGEFPIPRGRRVLLLACLLVACAVVAATNTRSALAAGPCGTSGVLSQSGATATCTYSNPGSEDTFTVPSGASSLAVTAVGAPGGTGRFGGSGGVGARVSNAALPVVAGASQLWVDVGAPSAAGTATANGGPGGAFDGAGGGSPGGGGGGSSAVLTMPRATALAGSHLTGNPATDARLLVAAAGGGGGDAGRDGGSAGNSAVTGAGAGGCFSNGAAGGVGPTDGTDGGGGKGCGTSSAAAGTAAAGGGGCCGGGGGGGWFGGGGASNSGGGGGGSSYGGAGSSGGIMISTGPSSPQVVITFIPAPAVSIAPAGLTFGSQQVGTASAAQQVTVTNAGLGPLSVNAVKLTGVDSDQFKIAYDGCNGQLVTTNASCVLSIRYVPIAGGAAGASAQIISNSPSSPDGISLSGTGTAPPPPPQGPQGPAGPPGRAVLRAPPARKGPPGRPAPKGQPAPRVRQAPVARRELPGPPARQRPN